MLNSKEINSNCTVLQTEGHIVSDMDGEKVMMSIQNGKYYNLGEVGGVIWDSIKSPVTVDRIVEKLAAEYAVEKSECEVEVISFLNQLSREGLITVE